MSLGGLGRGGMYNYNVRLHVHVFFLAIKVNFSLTVGNVNSIWRFLLGHLNYFCERPAL